MLLICIKSNAQSFANGPELSNDRDSRLNRILDGDDNCFYTYRIRSKAFGTSYYVEKFNKEELKPVFSKEINIEEDRFTTIEDVKYAAEKVYIFVSQFDKREDKMSLNFRSISTDGTVSVKPEEILNINTDRSEFVDFDIYQNPPRTKFLVKVSYKVSKETQYKTNFILYDAATMKQIFSKQVEQQLLSGPAMPIGLFHRENLNNTDFIGLMIDDDDNIFYGYTFFDKPSREKGSKFKVVMNILSANSIAPKTTELEFDDNYYVGRIKFTKPNSNQIVAGGFLKIVNDDTGKDVVKPGIFSFTVNIEQNKIESKTVTVFDDKMAAALELNTKHSRSIKYKLDYIIPSGTSVYYVGEQYREQQISSFDPLSRMSQTLWEYQYMDVIVAKLNNKGEFEWIKNTPLRISMTLTSPHLFKEYIAMATNKSIYIFNNESEKNIERYSKPDFEPKDLRTITGIQGTNFVSTAVDLENGTILHKLVFANTDYCFAPIQERNSSYIPPADVDIFVKGKYNEIFIDTENRGKERFCKITFE